MPQKNGNRNWAAFNYYVEKGRAPKTTKEALGNLGQRSRNEYPEEGDVFMVARNPYARALSYYLYKEADGRMEGKFGEKKHNRHNEPTAADFEAHVRATLGNGPRAACLKNHHLCPQARGRAAFAPQAASPASASN